MMRRSLSPRRPSIILDPMKSPSLSFHDEIILFTTTLYKDDETSKVRQELALKLFENAQALGIRCVVVDGGSNADFVSKAAAFDNVRLITMEKGTMGDGRREALREALTFGTPNMMWIEPEKDALVTAENIERILVPLRKGEADIVVPKRTREGFHSLPKLQSWMEKRANKRASQLVHERTGAEDAAIDQVWDLWFGPKAMSREGARYFETYKGKLDKWDAIIKPVHDAFRDGKKVASVAVDYLYDESQKENEEHNRGMKLKRIDQYVNILKELGDNFWIEKTKEEKETKTKMKIK